MRRLIVFAAPLFLVGFVNGASGQGVQTGTLRGTVLDEQSLPVPGVTVIVSSSALQGDRSGLTDGDGTFALRTLAPGIYDISFELTGFSPQRHVATVPLGGEADLHVTMRPAGVAEQVQVAAEFPSSAGPGGRLNLRQDEVDALATSRTLAGIATLAPGVNENAPNPTSGQLVISGAFAFDNVFMLDGVDVNDNVFGFPQDLFIEDAIEEVEVLSAGISAEYGRFSGGVVNAITKSGGNTFSGAYRVNLTNPAWISETPFEREHDVAHESDLNLVHEWTLGGPIQRDRLWFFAAGRMAKVSTAGTLDQTGISYVQRDDNRRAEIKATATAAPAQTFQAGYLNNHLKVTERPSFDFSLDRFSFFNETRPNWYAFGTYRGVPARDVLVEAHYSERRLAFEGRGGTDTALVNSPIFTITQEAGQYNAPFFDATDVEQRNNRQFTGNLTAFLERRGRHEVKSGYEFYASQLRSGGSQSAPGYVFYADYSTDAGGTPLTEPDGRLIPVFTPFETEFDHWLPVRGAVLSIRTQSIYARDRWTITRHLSADLGIRYERARSEATGGVSGVAANTVMPRLGLVVDPRGDGRLFVGGTYGHYAGRYNEAQFNANTNVGRPDLLLGVYTGPPGEAREFAPGFDPDNYVIYAGRFPSANVLFEDGLSSPTTREFTLSGGGSIGPTSYGELTYVRRNTADILEDFIDLSNGTTTVTRDGETYGPFTNSVYRNTDLAERHYQALIFEGRTSLRTNWTVNGFWTVELENEGNYEGEAANQPGLLSVIGNFPEAFTPARHYPTGHLQSFQRHRVRLWSIYSADLGRWGGMSLSGLLRVESPRVYSLVATLFGLTAIQESLLADYPDQPAGEQLFFGARGAQSFRGYGTIDVSANYNIPIWHDLGPWFKVEAFNVFNNDKQIGWNTAIRPDLVGPRDALGLATDYIESPLFGEATSTTHFPVARTLRMSFGLRF